MQDLDSQEPSMGKIIRIGIDTSKSVFVLHGVDENELPVLRKRLRRSQVLAFLATLEPTKIGLGPGSASSQGGGIGRYMNDVLIVTCNTTINAHIGYTGRVTMV